MCTLTRDTRDTENTSKTDTRDSRVIKNLDLRNAFPWSPKVNGKVEFRPQGIAGGVCKRSSQQFPPGLQLDGGEGVAGQDRGEGGDPPEGERLEGGHRVRVVAVDPGQAGAVPHLHTRLQCSNSGEVVTSASWSGVKAPGPASSYQYLHTTAVLQ